MFAQPPALLFFVAEKLADGEPFEWFFEFALVRRDHARERWRQLRAQGDFALTFVGEIEKLPHNFVTTLFFIQLGGFERRAFPLYKSVAAGHSAPARKDIIALRTILGQEIAEAGKRLHKRH